MDVHPSPESLIEHCEGASPRAHAAQIEAHLAGCAPCRQEVERLRAFGRAVSGRAPREGAYPEGLGDRLDAQARASLARPPPRRRAAWLAMAALLLAALALVLSRGAGGFDAVVCVTDPGGTERGSGPLRAHLELTLPEPRAVAVLHVSPSGVQRIYPHPNPVLGRLGMPEILPAGRAVRLPADPLLDFDVPRSGESRLVVVPSRGAFAAPALADLERMANAAFANARDAGAIVAELRGRWPEVLQRSIGR